MFAPLFRRLSTAYALPIELAALKTHLKVEHGEEDAYISDLAKAAGALWEAQVRQPVMQAEYVALTGRWQSLHLPTTATVTRVAYLDTEGVETDLEAARYNASALYPGRLDFKDAAGQPLPTLYRYGFEPDAVRVYYTAGAATPAALPPLIQQFIRLMTLHWYENRQEVIIGSIATQVPMGAQALIDLEREAVL